MEGKMELESEDRLSNLPVERKQKMEIESADRLSNLPEAVLLDIISFLNTKDAVRTSILSTNWTSVWKDLKSMHLQGFTIKKENFDPKIFTSCPRLQSLKLNDILLEDGIVMFRIASITLKSLELSFVRSESRGCQVIIDAPNLTSFSYEGYPSLTFDILKHSLEEVYFDLNWNPNVDNKNLDYQCLMIMLDGIRQTKSLTLSLSTIKILSEFHALLQESEIPYTDLKILNLRIEGECENFDIPRNVLYHFCKSSTSLEIC
ncbi:Uncharacterized protein TCM_045459 [Theobroma cacao]|uniref:F-box domain-containing protein n=1 Tax=Theobroma cacao TaxID=3641 RepID=A0A061FZ28_THECC|nr:Uncharacterized protein TCM_045459 [Theobroma cacao]